MLYRGLHALVMALLLPATAILVIGVIKLLSKDGPEDDAPEWARPYPGRQKRRRH